MDRPSSPPRKSLNRPSRPASPTRKSYDQYFEHPEIDTLDEILLHYLDIESLLKLYTPENYEFFESRVALNTLSQRFDLPRATNFQDFLKSYDEKYATVRSYQRPTKRKPEEIFIQAAEEGNIQAVVNGLKMYGEVRDEWIIEQAAGKAAHQGHKAIFELLLDLGADNYSFLLENAVLGGHLELVKKIRPLVKRFGPDCPDGPNIYLLAGQSGDLEILEYLLATSKRSADEGLSGYVLSQALEGAGRNGGKKIIDYLLSLGAEGPNNLFFGAAYGGHVELIKELAPELDQTDLRHGVFMAIQGGQVEALKYLFKVLKVPIWEEVFLKEAVLHGSVEVVKYLAEQGAVLSLLNWMQGLIEGEVGENMEIFQLYLDHTTNPQEVAEALDEIVNFSPSRHVSVFWTLANRYLEMTDRESLDTILEGHFESYILDGNVEDIQAMLPYMSNEKLEWALKESTDAEKIEAIKEEVALRLTL